MTIMTDENNQKTSNNTILFIRALIFYLGFGLSTLIIAPVIFIGTPLGFKRLYAISQWWTGFNIWWLKLTCGVDYEVHGVDNLPKKAVIVFAKHQSTWETLYLQCNLPPIAWVLKRELLWLPFFGWALKQLDPIAINRKSKTEAMRQLHEQGKAQLDNGRWVLIFPEGTRTAPGKRHLYKLGGARLAQQTGYGVLPIAHNAGEYWRRRSFIKYPGTIKVVIGPVIETQGMNAQQINDAAKQWIESTMTQISTFKYED